MNNIIEHIPTIPVPLRYRRRLSLIVIIQELSAGGNPYRDFTARNKPPNPTIATIGLAKSPLLSKHQAKTKNGSKDVGSQSIDSTQMGLRRNVPQLLL